MSLSTRWSPLPTIFLYLWWIVRVMSPPGDDSAEWWVRRDECAVMNAPSDELSGNPLWRACHSYVTYVASFFINLIFLQIICKPYRLHLYLRKILTNSRWSLKKSIMCLLIQSKPTHTSIMVHAYQISSISTPGSFFWTAWTPELTLVFSIIEYWPASPYFLASLYEVRVKLFKLVISK